MDEELAQAGQRLNDMSYKDLTARAAAAMKPNPTETAKTPAKETETKAVDTEAPAKPKTSSGVQRPRSPVRNRGADHTQHQGRGSR